MASPVSSPLSMPASAQAYVSPYDTLGFQNFADEPKSAAFFFCRPGSGDDAIPYPVPPRSEM